VFIIEENEQLRHPWGTQLPKCSLTRLVNEASPQVKLDVLRGRYLSRICQRSLDCCTITEAKHSEARTARNPTDHLRELDFDATCLFTIVVEIVNLGQAVQAELNAV
jgi:hypothetical protein